jgi:hypothetical protein
MLNRVIRPLGWKLDMPDWGNLVPRNLKAHWLEVGALALGIPALKLAFGWSDPFFLQTAFPWLLLPLLLIALRYGTLAAMAGFGMVLAAVLLYWQMLGESPNTDHLQQLAGMSIILLVVGELTGGWRQRYQEGQANLHSLRSDMSQVERELQVMQVSHAQLEEELLGVGHSLKRSLDIVKDTLPAHLPRASQTAWLADKMMEVLSAYSWLEAAAFLAVDGDLVINMQPLAQKGSLGVLRSNDRLLQEVLRSKKPVSFKRSAYLANAHEALGSNLIAVLPLLDKNRRVQMVLVVQHIQFAAYTQKNLNLLVTLCNWLGNVLPVKAVGQSQNKQVPPYMGLPGVVGEIHASLNLLLENKRSLALLAVSLPASSRIQQYNEFFAGLAHGSNRLWQVQQEGRTILVIVLPLSNPERFAHYQQSVEESFQQRFDQNLTAAGIGLFAQAISQAVKKQQVVEYLRGIK